MVKTPRRTCSAQRQLPCVGRFAGPGQRRHTYSHGCGLRFHRYLRRKHCRFVFAQSVAFGNVGTFLLKFVANGKFARNFPIAERLRYCCRRHERRKRFSSKFHGKVALVLGNEGNGLSEFSRKAVQQTVSLPMENNFESLNVAVAGSVIMYRSTPKLKQSNYRRQNIYVRSQQMEQHKNKSQGRRRTFQNIH